MKLMNKNLLGILKGTEETPTNLRNLIEWKGKYDKVKAIICLSLSDS